MTRAELAALSASERDAHYRARRRAEGVRYRATHPERSKASQAKYRTAHPERRLESGRVSYVKHRSKRIAYATAWNAAHPERRRATLRIARMKYDLSHKEAIATRRRAKHVANPSTRRAIVAKSRAKALLENPERQRAKDLLHATAWQRAHPDRVKLNVQRRRARQVGATVEPITLQDWQAICAEFGQRCAYCFRAGSLTQDHVEPLVGGGRHSVGNIVPACRSCNASKHATPLLQFLLRRRV